MHSKRKIIGTESVVCKSLLIWDTRYAIRDSRSGFDIVLKRRKNSSFEYPVSRIAYPASRITKKDLLSGIKYFTFNQHQTNKNMDQHQSPPLFQLNLDANNSYTLRSAASWAKVLGIVGIIIGILCFATGFLLQNA